jgi:CBS domain-containing protein
MPLWILATGVCESDWKAAARTGKHLILHAGARRWKSRVEGGSGQRAFPVSALILDRPRTPFAVPTKFLFQEDLMKVRDLMTARIAKAQMDTTLEEIAMMMKTENIGAIPVVDEDELIGMVTDRDIVMRCVADGGDPTEMTAEDIVTEELETIDPDSEVHEAMELMSRRQIRRLAVVDRGELVGMVSLGDIAVKQDDEEGSAQILKDVSFGVKGATDSRRTPAQPMLNSEAFGDDLEMDAPERAALDEASHRNAKEEIRRQSRVIPFRADAGSAARRQKKSSKDKAS